MESTKWNANGSRTPARPVQVVDAREHSVADAAATPYLNRELSWLDFNGRVLAEAMDPRVPLLERLKLSLIHI